MQYVRSFIVTLALCWAAGSAGAEPFDSLVESSLNGNSAIARESMLWAHWEQCGLEKNDMERRICLGLKSSRQSQIADRTYLITAKGVLKADKYNRKRRSSKLTLHGCVTCDVAVQLSGRPHFITGPGKPTIVTGSIQAKAVATTARVFDNEAAASKWLAEVPQRLVTDFVVRVPSDAEAWIRGELRGFNVDVVGYRVYDPCDGAVVMASPEAGPGPTDATQCRGDAVVK